MTKIIDSIPAIYQNEQPGGLLPIMTEATNRERTIQNRRQFFPDYFRNSFCRADIRAFCCPEYHFSANPAADGKYRQGIQRKCSFAALAGSFSGSRRASQIASDSEKYKSSDVACRDILYQGQKSAGRNYFQDIEGSE